MRELNLSARFWSKVDIRGPNECWPWTANRHSRGYGLFHLMKINPSNTTTAHRVAYMLSVGPVADGAEVRHSCDNPPCCNPSHLSVGTHKDNMADRKARYGHPWDNGSTRGIGHPRTKFTEKDILTIRRDKTKTARQLAEIYGVAESTISAIRTRQNWKHLN